MKLSRDGLRKRSSFSNNIDMFDFTKDVRNQSSGKNSNRKDQVNKVNIDFLHLLENRIYQYH